MTPLVHDDEVWALPGPTRWVSAIARQLQTGGNVLVELPRVEAPASVLSRVEEVLRPAAFHSIREIDATDLGGSDPGPAALLKVVAARVLGETMEVARPSDLLDQVPRGGVLVEWDLRGMDASQLVGVVEGVDQLSRMLSPGGTGRTKEGVASLVILDSDPGEPDLQSLQRFSWRYVLEPLDARVFARNRSSAGQLPISQDVLDILVDLAGSDLELVAMAINAPWQGGIDEFRELLDKRWCERGVDELAVGQTSAPDLWRIGCEVRSLREVRMALDLPPMATKVNTEFWRAQLRTVFPLLEDDRVRVIELAERRKKEPFIERIGQRSEWNDVEHYSEAEIGQLFRNRRCFVDAQEFIEWLRETRNSLAHRSPIPVHKLEQGARLRQQLFGT